MKVDGKITARGRITILGPVRGNGRIDGNEDSALSFIDVGGPLDVGSSPGTLTMGGAMQFRNTATPRIELAGTQTNQFDLLRVTGAASVNGTLAINVIEDFRPAAVDSFTVVQAGSVLGEFSNAPNGQRLATIDGYGSFLVRYSDTNVVLTAFEANPDPSPTAAAHLQSLTFGFDNVKLNLAGSSGREYILQTSTNLFHWPSILTNAADLDGRLLFDIAKTAVPTRFFRAVGR